MISTTRFGFTRTLVVSFTTQSYVSPDTGTNIFQFSGPNLYAAQGFPAMDGSITLSFATGLGAGQIDPFSFVQNKYTGSEDLLWSRGAHNLRFGGEVKRVFSDANHPFPAGGTWTFSTLQGFLQNSPSQYSGPTVSVKGVTASPFQDQPFSSVHRFRENDYAIYVQDDWRVRPTLNLNLGLRYEPTTNPYDLNPASAILNPPFAEGTKTRCHLR